MFFFLTSKVTCCPKQCGGAPPGCRNFGACPLHQPTALKLVLFSLRRNRLHRLILCASESFRVAGLRENVSIIKASSCLSRFFLYEHLEKEHNRSASLLADPITRKSLSEKLTCFNKQTFAEECVAVSRQEFKPGSRKSNQSHTMTLTRTQLLSVQLMRVHTF